MSTPPAVDPDVPQFQYDPSWALFDENSMRIAAEPFFQQDGAQISRSMQSSVGASQPQPDSLESQGSQGFGNQETWNSYEPPPDAWPSNLLRLFGNGEFPPPS